MDKHLLKQFRRILREIDHLEAEKKRILDNYLAPPVLSGMPSSHGDPDRIGNLVARRGEYQDMIDAKIDELINLRLDIEDAISGLPSCDRELIRLRYVEGWPWEKIAVELHYTYHHVLKKHGWILARMKRKNND